MSKDDGFDALLDGMVRDGQLNEKIDPEKGQVFSLSGKGALNAKRIIRECTGQPDACVCEYLMIPHGRGQWAAMIYKPNENCDWHVEAIKRFVAGTATEDDASHARLFVYALDERRCNVCGKPAFRTTPGGTQECRDCDSSKGE